jgi:hypothetical protein
MATPERSLPPAKIVLIALAGLAVVLAIYGFVGRAKPQGAGSLDNIAVVEIPGQNSVLVALTVTLKNSGEKPLWIHNIEGKFKTTSEETVDGKVKTVTKEYCNEARGTVIVGFPVTQADFDKRQSVSVVVHPYDQPLPVELKK